MAEPIISSVQISTDKTSISDKFGWRAAGGLSVNAADACGLIMTAGGNRQSAAEMTCAASSYDYFHARGRFRVSSRPIASAIGDCT